MKHSVISSIQTVWIQQTTNVLIAIHCVLTLTIVLNPLNQEIEEYFKVPHRKYILLLIFTMVHSDFGLKRVITRTCIMLCVVFVAETVPNFGPLLDLFGGSTMTLTGLVFPCLFFLRLNAGAAEENNGKVVDAGELSISE